MVHEKVSEGYLSARGNCPYRKTDIVGIQGIPLFTQGPQFIDQVPGL